MTEETPPLRTGWEPDTPVSDTLHRQWVFNVVATAVVPIAAMGGRVLRRDDFVAADVGRPASFYNSAVLMRPLTAERAPSVMGALDDFFLGHGRGTVFLWSPWPSINLRTYGWDLAGHPPLMTRPPGGAAPPLPPGLRIDEVHDRAGLETWEEVVVTGYPLDDMKPFIPGRLMDERVLGDDRLRFWVGYADGRPVAASAAVIDSGLNGVTMIAALPEARGRGIGAAMTWQATMARPDLPAALMSSDLGRPVYERIGYIPITRFTLWYMNRQ